MSEQDRPKNMGKNIVNGGVGGRIGKADIQTPAITRSVSKLAHQHNCKHLPPPGKCMGAGKNGNVRSKQKLNFVSNGSQQSRPQRNEVEEVNCLEGELNMDFVDAVGSNNHSPGQEENQNIDLTIMPSNEPGGSKRNATRKFVDRVEMTLTVHEVADPIPRETNESNNTLPRIRTQYMHENISTRNVTPENDGNSSQASTSNAKRKRGQRGKYKSYVIEKKTLGGTAKLVVDIPDYVLQAVGENARNLVNFCGHIVRTKVLMDASPWIQVAAKHGDAMWLLVKNKFSIMDNNQLPRLKAFVLFAMQRLYRYWKARLHSYYKECGDTHEERLENPPTDFDPENWIKCCETFNSDKFKKMSEQNSKNRKSDKWCQHTTGNLSFPEVETIMTKKNGDVKPSADVIWLAEHTRTNDQGVLEWVNDGRSKKIHGDLHHLVTNKDKEGAPQTQEEMLLQVLGPKSGYTRGKGSGYGGSLKSRIQEEQQQKIIQQQSKIDEQQVKIDEQQNKICSLQSQIDELKEKQDQSMAAFEKRMLEMSQMMATNIIRSRNTLEDDGDAFHGGVDDDY